MASISYRSHLESELQRPDTHSIIRIVRLMLADAQSRNASDIHIDPSAKETSVRLRIDGMLSAPYSLPTNHHDELIARLKILGRLRIDQHFSPQDGRFTFIPQDGEDGFDVRLSIIPSQYGESAVLRLLLPLEKNSLSELGLLPDQEIAIEQELAQPHGLLLIVGPTGSGKTTTLYSFISRLDRTQRSIVSIEDPIEYSISGIRQIQVMPKYGLSFADGLRAILRQDPDVIIIGEIRDEETARLAVSAAHTGHLVLSTLHAANAEGAASRLLELGVPPERLSAIRMLVVNQKLIRMECPDCAPDILADTCEKCGGRGHSGRRGIFELLYA